MAFIERLHCNENAQQDYSETHLEGNELESYDHEHLLKKEGIPAEGQSIKSRNCNFYRVASLRILSLLICIVLVACWILLNLSGVFQGEERGALRQNEYLAPEVPTADFSSKTSPCGNTSTQAMERGCRMEAMLYGWMPQDCYYEEFSQNYHPFEDRRWYHAPYARDEYLIKPEDLHVGKYSHVWATAFHEAHCLFSWTKLAFAVEKQKPWIDNKALNFAHSNHCASTMVQVKEEPFQIVEVRLNFRTCMAMPGMDNS